MEWEGDSYKGSPFCFSRQISIVDNLPLRNAADPGIRYVAVHASFRVYDFTGYPKLGLPARAEAIERKIVISLSN